MSNVDNDQYQSAREVGQREGVAILAGITALGEWAKRIADHDARLRESDARVERAHRQYVERKRRHAEEWIAEGGSPGSVDWSKYEY